MSVQKVHSHFIGELFQPEPVFYQEKATQTERVQQVFTNQTAEVGRATQSLRAKEWSKCDSIAAILGFAAVGAVAVAYFGICALILLTV